MDKEILKAQRKENVDKWTSRNPTQTNSEKEKPKRPELTTPSKRRSENRLSRTAITPKGSEEKNKKLRKISNN